MWKGRGPPSWTSQTALRVQILCMSCKEKKKKTPSTPISKVKGETTPACPTTNVRGAQMQPENTATFLCCVPACRQGLRTLTYTELWGDPCWGYSVTHRCSNLREDGAWTSLFSPTLLHSTAEPTNTNIYCTWKCYLVSVCLGFRWPEGKREVVKETKWVRKEMPFKSQGWLGFSGSTLLSSHSR